MTEELINDLGQVSTLRVISLTSSMSYKGTKKTLPEIAHELSVDGVVEGGVLREGNQVRVSVDVYKRQASRKRLTPSAGFWLSTSRLPSLYFDEVAYGSMVSSSW